MNLGKLLGSSLLVPTLAACAGKSGPCVQISRELSIAPQGDSDFLRDCKAIVAGSPDAESATDGVVALTSGYYGPDSFFAQTDDPLISNILEEYYKEQAITYGSRSVEGGN